MGGRYYEEWCSPLLLPPLARICFVCQGRSGSSNRLQLLFRGEKEKNPFSPPFYYWKVFRRVRDFIVWLFHLYVESPLFWWFSCFFNAEISLLNSRYWFFKSLQKKFYNILSSSQLTSIMFSWVISYLNLHVLCCPSLTLKRRYTSQVRPNRRATYVQSSRTFYLQFMTCDSFFMSR